MIKVYEVRTVHGEIMAVFTDSDEAMDYAEPRGLVVKRAWTTPDMVQYIQSVLN